MTGAPEAEPSGRGGPTPAPGPVWVDGTLVAHPDAAVSAFDHGLLTGDGVFETVLVREGRTFALGRHLDRLARSARGLGLPVPARAELERAAWAVVGASGLAQGRLRITLTGGPGPLTSERSSAGPSLIVAASPLAERPSSASVVVVPWPRNERGAVAGLKTISYVENVVALAHARQRGAGEAVFANLAGHLCEGTGSNLFVARGGRLATPPLRSGCLAGVTRDLVLEALAATEAQVVEDDLPVAALAQANEAFLTSTTRGVQPVATVDGSTLPACPGPLTQAASRAYQALLANGDEP